MVTGMPVSCLKRSAKPLSRAPPPVNTMPRSMMSPQSSGGVLSSVDLTASTILVNGSSNALLISSAVTTIVRGN